MAFNPGKENTNTAIETLIDKLSKNEYVILLLGHQDLEISARALKNLEMKLKVKIYSFENIHILIIEKLINNLVYWLGNTASSFKDNEIYKEYVSKALHILRGAVELVDREIIQNLRENKIIDLLNNIMGVDESFRNVCGEIIKTIVNVNVAITQGGSKINTSENKFCCEEYSFRPNTQKNPILIVEDSYRNFNNTITNKGNMSTYNENNTNENIFIQPQITKTTIRTQDKITPQANFLTLTPNFPFVTISKNDEQIFFDLNINLKYGDSLQISTNLYIFYSVLLNDFPIEYLLQNSDLLKTFLVIVEKSNFYEFGFISFKILDRIFYLLEKKVQNYQEAYIKTSPSFTKKNTLIEDNVTNVFYPPFNVDSDKNFNVKNKSKLTAAITNNSDNSISIRDFLVLSTEALLLSMYELDKFPFSLNLIQKTFDFLRKVIFNQNSNDEWIAILYHILTKTHCLIEYYKKEKVHLDSISKFFLNFLINLNEEAFAKFLLTGADNEMINLIKDVVFIFEDYKDQLILTFFEKIEKVIEKLGKEDSDLKENLRRILDDYNNAEIVRKSLLITKSLNTGVRNTLEDYQYILENFDNILISYKYFIEVENSSNIGNEISFIQILCDSFEMKINKELILTNFSKLFSFSNTTQSNASFKFKINLFKSLLDNIKIREKLIFIEILKLKPNLILYLINEISKENLSSDLENMINEILYEIYDKIIQMQNSNQGIDDSSNKILFEIFSFTIPVVLKNLKNTSLHNKIDLKSNKINLFLKYLRLLFNKDEMIRLNVLNYFQLFTLENFVANNKMKIIQFVDFTSNYEKMKKVDIIYAIQSAEKEFSNIVRNIIQNENIEIEFYPLLNILYSNKLEHNFKVSAIEQIILLVNKKEYKNVFLTEILDHVLSELKEIFSLSFLKNFDCDNFKNIGNDLINYLGSLLKLLNLIIFFNPLEEKVKSIVTLSKDGTNTNANDLLTIIQNLFKIIFSNIKNKHLLSIYIITFLFNLSFNQNNQPKILTENLEEISIPKIYIKNYFMNILPNKDLSLFFSNESEFWKKINYNKHVIEYLQFKNENELKHIYDISQIKSDLDLYIQNYLQNYSHNEPDYLEVYFCVCKFFSYLIYEAGNTGKGNFSITINNYSKEIISIFTFFKKILPIKNEEKNIISDFLNIVSVCMKINSKIISENKIAIKTINDIMLNYINFISTNKDFMDGLSKHWGENQILMYSILEFLNEAENIKIFVDFNFSFISKNKELCQKFISTFSNLLIFDDSFYAIRLSLIKFQNLYFETLIMSSSNNNSYSGSEEIYQKQTNYLINSINNIDFYLSKYELSDSFTNNNFIESSLLYLNKIITNFSENQHIKDQIIKKSFSLIKFLNSNFYEINFCVLEILNNLISKDFFQKHPVILTTIYDSILNDDLPYLNKINYLNFINLSLEFIFKNKEINFCSEEKDSEDFFIEMTTLNSKLFEQSQTNILLTIINKNINSSSLFCSLIFRLINNILIINSSSDDNEINTTVIKQFYFNSNFFETVNDVLIKEKENLKQTITSNLSVNFNYYDKNFNRKLYLTSKVENNLIFTECLTLLLKSFTKIEFKKLIEKFKILFNDIFINIFHVGIEIRNIFNSKIEREEFTQFFNKNNIFIFNEFISKYFSYINFNYHFDVDFIIENLNTMKNINHNYVQEFFYLLYDLLKFEEIINEDSASNSDYNFDIRLMFAKNLPYLIETINYLNKEENSDQMTDIQEVLTIKKNLYLKNEGEILLDLMTAFKTVYEIKVDCYDAKVKCKYEIDEKNLSSKNVFMNAISSILLESQKCKKIFVKSKFVNVFIDYIRQMTSSLYEINLNKENENISNSLVKKSAKDRTNVQLLDYILNEFKNVLVLFQNLLYNFEDCEEKNLLFVKSGTSNKTNSNVKTSSKLNFELEKPQKFFKLLFDIFYETIRYPILFENYLQLLINTISKNDNAKKSFILPLNDSKETFVSLILEYFNKNFMTFVNNPHFDLFIKFLRCLFQNKFIVLYLLKTKFVDNLSKDFENLINNKKFVSNSNNQKFINNILSLFVSLTFDSDISKKLATKDFVENLTNLLIKVKNENIIYNTIFILRNFSFITTNKLHFLVNENLFGTIFALLTGDCSIKIKFIISHLIWILLYNNQTLKGILNKDEFKTELKSIQIHLQKEYDMKKYISKEEKEKFLEDTCLNFRKITHILEI